MSLSKTITAAAVMKLLLMHSRRLSDGLDTEIAPFLPWDWDKSKIPGLTLRHLLRHEVVCTSSSHPIPGMHDFRAGDASFHRNTRILSRALNMAIICLECTLPSRECMRT